MQLTGKCAEAFEKWYESQSFMYHDGTEEEIAFIFFDVMPESFKYGVYVDFADSVGIYINKLCPDSFEIWNAWECYEDVSPVDRTRAEARTAAVNKFNEIYNDNYE